MLDRTLSAVFRGKLGQSPQVTLLSGSGAKAKLLQMQHKADDPLTLTLAREVCERSESQAVVAGSVARSGSGHVLTEEATKCVDGASLGQASRTVAKADELPSVRLQNAETNESRLLLKATLLTALQERRCSGQA